MAPSRARAMTGGSWARSAASRSPATRTPNDGIVAPGADPAPGTASVATTSPPTAAAIAAARAASSATGVAAIRQNGTRVTTSRRR